VLVSHGFKEVKDEDEDRRMKDECVEG